MMETEHDSDSEAGCTVQQEIKVIITGSKSEYKCSAANTILGQNVCKVGKEIVESEIKQRRSLNRSVDVVLTPGWWRTFTLAESAKYIQTEIVHSLVLCPAPHAFLLVINLNREFTAMHLNSVVEHMEILGEQIWDHTIVLLMYVNTKEKNADTKQLIENAGTHLNTVIKKCGNRVHVFNFTGGINVEKLFHEIENLVSENKGECLKIDRKLLENMEEKKRMVKKRTEERETEVKTKMQTLKEHLTEKVFTELSIVLMGGRIVGKTSVMHTILATKQEVSRTKKCAKREGEVEKRKVILIDTPGWSPYSSVEETPDSIKQEIHKSVTLCSPGTYVVLLVLQSGVAFSRAYGRSVEEHMELLGVNVWKHCIVVFTRGDWMGTPSIEEHIESEGETLQWLINKCGNRYHVLNNMQDDRKQVSELIEKMEMMVRTNKELLTPVKMMAVGNNYHLDQEIQDDDSGHDSNPEQRPNLNLVPPNMNDNVIEWLEKLENTSDLSDDLSKMDT